MNVELLLIWFLVTINVVFFYSTYRMRSPKWALIGEIYAHAFGYTPWNTIRLIIITEKKKKWNQHIMTIKFHLLLSSYSWPSLLASFPSNVYCNYIIHHRNLLIYQDIVRVCASNVFIIIDAEFSFFFSSSPRPTTCIIVSCPQWCRLNTYKSQRSDGWPKFVPYITQRRIN
jgi:hypothetical protein